MEIRNFSIICIKGKRLHISRWKISGTEESKAIMQVTIQQVGLAMQHHECAPERCGAGEKS